MSNTIKCDSQPPLVSNIDLSQKIKCENKKLRTTLLRTQKKMACIEKELELLYNQSQVDSLTKTPTRIIFQDRAIQLFKKAKRENSFVAVIFIDVDNFKYINDTYGHASGDFVLIQLCERFRNVLRSSDTICRYGGDEFLLLVPFESFIDYIHGICTKILDCVRNPMLVDKYLLDIRVSLGVSVYPLHGDSILELISVADSCMYIAKRAGGQSYRIAQN